LGLVPMFVGILVFSVSLLLRAGAIESIRMLTIAAIVSSVILGVICLIVWAFGGLASGVVSRRTAVWHVAGLTILYAINLVVAGVCLDAAEKRTGYYTVCVVNHGYLPLESARLYYGGLPDISLGDIPSGASVRKGFWIQHDGTIMFDAACPDGRKVSAQVSGYVTSGLGGCRVVSIDAQGRASVRDK
jgi:hypothetical protein